MWRVHCRLFGPEGEPRWFVVRDHADGQDTVRNERGLPLPFITEEAALEKAAQLNGIWADFDVRR